MAVNPRRPRHIWGLESTDVQHSGASIGRWRSIGAGHGIWRIGYVAGFVRSIVLWWYSGFQCQAESVRGTSQKVLGWRTRQGQSSWVWRHCIITCNIWSYESYCDDVMNMQPHEGRWNCSEPQGCSGSSLLPAQRFTILGWPDLCIVKYCVLSLWWLLHVLRKLAGRQCILRHGSHTIVQFLNDFLLLIKPTKIQSHCLYC